MKLQLHHTTTSILTNLSNDKYLWITARANTGYVFDGVLVPMKIKISGLPISPINKYKQNILNSLGTDKTSRVKKGLDEIKSKAKSKIVINSNGNYDYTIPNFAIFFWERR